MKLIHYVTSAALGVLLSLHAAAGKPELVKLWQSDASLKVPESVLYDGARQVLYASNIDGEKPWEDDGKGSIAKLSLDGTVINAEWVTGLNAPKGMGMSGNYLYVTDNDDVVTIDIKAGKIVERLPVPNAASINDLAVSENGTIFITDSTKGEIHTLINGVFANVVKGINGLNGVHHSNDELLFAADGGLHIFENGKVKKIAGGMEGHVDGVERIDQDSWLVSCWLGTVYHVTRKGKVTLLLDGRPDEISAADLGYDPVKKIAYFPGFWKNFVAAYQLKI